MYVRVTYEWWIEKIFGNKRLWPNQCTTRNFPRGYDENSQYNRYLDQDSNKEPSKHEFWGLKLWYSARLKCFLHWTTPTIYTKTYKSPRSSLCNVPCSLITTSLLWRKSRYNIADLSFRNHEAHWTRLERGGVWHLNGVFIWALSLHPNLHRNTDYEASTSGSRAATTRQENWTLINSR